MSSRTCMWYVCCRHHTRTSHDYGRFLSPPPPLPHIDSHAQNLPVSSPSWRKVSPPPLSVQYEISANHSLFRTDKHGNKKRTARTHAHGNAHMHTILVTKSQTISSMIATDSGCGAFSSPNPYIMFATFSHVFADTHKYMRA